MSSQRPTWVSLFFPVAKLAVAARVLSVGIEPRVGLVRSTWICWGFGGGESWEGVAAAFAGGNDGKKASSAAWKNLPGIRFMKHNWSTWTALVDKVSHVQQSDFAVRLEIPLRLLLLKLCLACPAKSR
jgi:hypothetical protein